MNEIPLNRGSSRSFTGTFRSKASGQPLDLTGWSIALFEPHPSLAVMTVDWVDPALGTFECRIPWSDDIPHGKQANFRLRASKDDDHLSSKLIWLVVQ